MSVSNVNTYVFETKDIYFPFLFSTKDISVNRFDLKVYTSYFDYVTEKVSSSFFSRNFAIFKGNY